MRLGSAIVGLVVVVALTIAPAAFAQSRLAMTDVQRIAHKQGEKLMIVYDASDYRTSCFRTGHLTARCRIRLIDAIDTEGNYYDCSIWSGYRLRADGYIHSRSIANFC